MSYQEERAKVPETASDGMTLRQVCPKCGKTNVVLLSACCKYQELGWELVKKCPLLCGYIERVL